MIKLFIDQWAGSLPTECIIWQLITWLDQYPDTSTDPPWNLGVISCHDPVTKYIYDCYQLNLTIQNLNFHMSSKSHASIVCSNFFQIESCRDLKIFYSCCLHGILLGLFSFPLQDHIVSAVHRMVDQKEVPHFSTQKYRKEGIHAKTRDGYFLLVDQ